MKIAALLALSALPLTCCANPGERAPVPAAPARLPTEDSRMDWWREARFGLFVHWGLYAILEGEWKGKTDYGEWIRHSAQIPRDEYARLTGRFTIPDFDAGRWADLAKAAGMRYVVITTKHHDGFCLWPSDLTGFDVASTPAGRDIMKEIANAFRARGLEVCWYHSIMDWNHPDYLPRRNWEADRSAEGADFDRYVSYLHGQVEELLTRYGPIGVMWFDGEWEATWNHGYGRDLYELCRRLQPDVIVNNRVDKGRGGMAGMTTGPGFVGDFGTPEQEIPPTGLPGVDWETCMTMNRHWGWNRADTVWKSPRDLIRKLCDIASKGGNFLLNVGPRPDGTFPDLAVERLEAIGRWMEKHAEAIHGTSASPVDAPEWGRITLKRRGPDSTLYLHVFDWPTDGQITLDHVGNRPLKARLLTTGRFVSVERDGSAIVVGTLPEEMPDEDCSVIAIDIEGAPIVYRAPEIRAAADRFLDTVEVTIDAGSPDLMVRYTADGSAPTAESPGYERPIVVARTTTVRARSFHRGAAVGPLAERRFEKVAPRPAVTVDEESLEPGLWREVFPGSFDVVPDFADAVPEGERVGVSQLALPLGPSREHVAMRFTGFLEIPVDGVYTVALASDDGSVLWLGDEVLVDNDGLHGTEIKSRTIALAAGLHPITVGWFNKTGGAELGLMIAEVGAELETVAAERLRRVR